MVGMNKIKKILIRNAMKNNYQRAGQQYRDEYLKEVILKLNNYLDELGDYLTYLNYTGCYIKNNDDIIIDDYDEKINIQKNKLMKLYKTIASDLIDYISIYRADSASRILDYMNIIQKEQDKEKIKKYIQLVNVEINKL